MTHKSHVKFISFNRTMLNGSLCGRRRRKTALIDQRAVAAGKNPTSLLSDTRLTQRDSQIMDKVRSTGTILKSADQIKKNICILQISIIICRYTEGYLKIHTFISR